MFTKALENILRLEKDPNRGTILVAVNIHGCEGQFPLRQLLASEIRAWKRVLANYKQAANCKRFGISRNRIRLIFAQEFVGDWSLRHLGKEVKLRPIEIAQLIDTLHAAEGVENLDPTDSELIGKAIGHFQKNELNQVFLREILKNPEALVY